jgi:hypothetical protein
MWKACAGHSVTMVLPRADSTGALIVVIAGLAISQGGCSPADALDPGGGAGSPTGAAGSLPGAGTGTLGGGGSAIPTTSGGTAAAGQQGSGGVFGSGGSSGSAGAGGSNAAAGTGGGTAHGSGPSPGCQMQVTGEEPQVAIFHDLMVNVAEKYKAAYTKRKYYTNLPKDFDPTKPYPIIFYGQGCGQTGPESGPFSGGHFASEVLYVQLIPAAVTGDTVVPSNGSPGCFQAGKQGLADSPDGPYFDQVLAEIEQKYCVDQSKVYVAGWSSGAWLSNYLACARGNVITGTAAGSGGLQHDHGACTGGGVKAIILDGDAGSIMEGGFDIGAAAARDVLVAAGPDSMTSIDAKFGADACKLYSGESPVAWCPVGGGHGGPLGSIAEAAWAFWSAP